MSDAPHLTDQQKNLLALIAAAGEKGRGIGSFDHRPAAQLVALRLIEPVGARRYRARPVESSEPRSAAVDGRSRAQRVLAILAEHGPMATHFIASAVGVSVEKAGNTLGSMLRAGKIVRHGYAGRPRKGALGGPKKTTLWALPEPVAGAEPRGRR